jgi:hypothetical protein
METAQKRPVLFGKLLIASLVGVALIAAVGLLAANDTLELPVIGGNEKTADIRDDAPANRMPGASIPASAGDAGSDHAATTAGHRHELYLDEGYQFESNLARPAGARSNPIVPSNHRYFFLAPELGDASASYPENHRIGQATD